MTGRKDDGGKLQWSLLPVPALKEIIRVLMKGAEKYDVDNWKAVPGARERYYNGMMRHIHAWWEGEKNDPEWDLSHLAHAGCCLLFLLWFEARGYPEERQVFCYHTGEVNTVEGVETCDQCGATRTKYTGWSDEVQP